MFNFLMSYGLESWDQGFYEYELSRFLEGTDEKIKAKYKDLNLNTLTALKQMPTLFAIEGERKESRVGYIENIKVRGKHLYIEFKFDPLLPPIPMGALVQLEKPFDIRGWGINRTRWDIKDADLFFELIRAGFITQDQADTAISVRKVRSGRVIQNNIDVLNNDHVFIVHGHDEEAKYQVASFVRSVGLTPIILHEQASQGKTIIEKIETYTNVGFAIVLYTPCDVGNARSAFNPVTGHFINLRARQNVVLEHGYLMAKLGRERVAALVKGDVETPNDVSGVVYTSFDIAGKWQQDLRRELIAAGISLPG